MLPWLTLPPLHPHIGHRCSPSSESWPATLTQPARASSVMVRHFFVSSLPARPSHLLYTHPSCISPCTVRTCICAVPLLPESPTCPMACVPSSCVTKPSRSAPYGSGARMPTEVKKCSRDVHGRRSPSSWRGATGTLAGPRGSVSICKSPAPVISGPVRVLVYR
ncbi:hypothetical protein C8Q74DRAFT_692225 [Fomes fomentarius]|nr:hypothetical protein C8Q74DRAFT_692225 [Fomes fomentarius]